MFSAFGAAVFVPVILFIIAKCMGVTGKKAFNTALLRAVGLTGSNLVINSHSAIIAPVVNQMVTNAGVKPADARYRLAVHIGYRVFDQGRPDLHRRCNHSAACAVLHQVDERIYGIRSVEQLLFHGLGLHAVCSDRQQ